MLVPDWMKSLAVLPILCVFTPVVFVLAALCASSSGRSLYYYRQAIRGHEDEVETEVTGKFSTLGVHIISKMYFTTGMFITSVLLLLNYLFWFATRADIVRRLHLSDTSLPKMQTCSMWMACTSAVALNILAAYSLDQSPSVHNLAKLVFFCSSLVHMVLNLEDRWCEYKTRWVIWTVEYFITLITGTTFVSLESVVHVNRSSLWVFPSSAKTTEKSLEITEMLFEYTTFVGILLHVLLMCADMRHYGVHSHQILRKTSETVSSRKSA